MAKEILVILQSIEHRSLCKISSETQKSSGDYYLIILTKTLTEIVKEAASW